MYGEKKMKKLPEITETICTKAVQGIMLIISLVLGYWAIRYTHGYPADLSEDQILIEPDSMGVNLLVMLVLLAVTWLLQRVILRGDPEKQRRKVRLRPFHQEEGRNLP